MDIATEQVDRDVVLMSQIAVVPEMLQVVSRMTGLGYAAVARVTEDSWTACAVFDAIDLGVGVGDKLPIETTLCRDSRAARAPIVIGDVASDQTYADHPAPRIYGLGAYISVPIILNDGFYFGSLFAVDRQPSPDAVPRSIDLLKMFAGMIAREIEDARQQDALKTALSTARLTAAQRETFIAVLGHDLRDPVAAVATIGELLQHPLPAHLDVQSLGQQLINSAARMSSMISDVLDFARGRLGSGVVVDRRVEPDLGARFEELITELRTAFPDRVLHSHIAIDVPVVCDGSRLQQVLSNLIRNAFVHGARDQPVVVAISLEADGEPPRLQISVRNGGEPIPVERLAQIFEPFDAQPRRRGRSNGLGLGLFIAREIVRAHGGRIGVRSDARGTLFEAMIPCRA